MEWIYNEVHIYLVIICVYCILIFIILIIILRYMYIMSHIPLHLEQMNNIIISNRTLKLKKSFLLPVYKKHDI